MVLEGKDCDHVGVDPPDWHSQASTVEHGKWHEKPPPFHIVDVCWATPKGRDLLRGVQRRNCLVIYDDFFGIPVEPEVCMATKGSSLAIPYAFLYA